MTCKCGNETNFTTDGEPQCMDCLIAAQVAQTREDDRTAKELTPRFGGNNYSSEDLTQ